VKTVSDKIVSHSLASTRLGTIDMGDVTLVGENLAEAHPPQAKGRFDFQSIFARSASAVTPSQKKFN